MRRVTGGLLVAVLLVMELLMSWGSSETYQLVSGKIDTRPILSRSCTVYGKKYIQSYDIVNQLLWSGQGGGGACV